MASQTSAESLEVVFFFFSSKCETWPVRQSKAVWGAGLGREGNLFSILE